MVLLNTPQHWQSYGILVALRMRVHHLSAEEGHVLNSRLSSLSSSHNLIHYCSIVSYLTSTVLPTPTTNAASSWSLQHPGSPDDSHRKYQEQCTIQSHISMHATSQQLHVHTLRFNMFPRHSRVFVPRIYLHNIIHPMISGAVYPPYIA